jgi:hypothetical protein
MRSYVRTAIQSTLNMKKTIINLIALFTACCTALLIDVTYCYLMKGSEALLPSTLLFSFECLTIGISIFAFLYTYSFYKNKLEDLW